MKYRVIGWTFYGDSQIESCDADCAAYAAVVDDIKEYGWYFSGWDHQETGYCVPVLNDGKARCFSQRGWGGVMAEAYGYYGAYDYSLFAEGSFAGGDGAKLPDGDLYPENFQPEQYLNEDIAVEVPEATFNAACEGGEITLSEEGRVRYLEGGDTLLLTCGDRSDRYLIEGITSRRRVLPDDVAQKLKNRENAEEFEAAEKIAARTPVTRWVKLGRKVTGEDDIETLTEHRQVDNVNKHSLTTCLTVMPAFGHEQAVKEAVAEITHNWMEIGGKLEIGYNSKYDVDVNVMIRRTLKDLFGKEDVLKRLQTEEGAYISLEIVPTINSSSANPAPILSLDADIIKFLYLSGAAMDLDYYIL